MADVMGTGRAAGVGGDAMENLTGRIRWDDPHDPRVDGWRADERDIEGARRELEKLTVDEIRCVVHAARILTALGAEVGRAKVDQSVIFGHDLEML